MVYKSLLNSNEWQGLNELAVVGLDLPLYEYIALTALEPPLRMKMLTLTIIKTFNFDYLNFNLKFALILCPRNFIH